MDCDHEFEDTGVRYATCDTNWINTLAVVYCPRCRRFGTRLYAAMDGKRLVPPTEITRNNKDEQQRMRRERIVWLREHYPDHVQEEEHARKGRQP